MGQNTDRKVDLFQWQDNIEEQEQNSIIQQKQAFKERDGFCRRVDSYDGQVLTVEGKPAYELGNYLGGGVAGVVYEGHRLQPISEYPVRTGPYNPHGSSNNSYVDQSTTDNDTVSSFLCMPASAGHAVQDTTVQIDARDTSALSMSSATGLVNNDQGSSLLQSGVYEEIALETTQSETDKNLTVIIDSVDAPSRSKHFAKAMSSLGNEAQPHHLNSDAAYATSLVQEPVAIKILNPVGFRTLPVSVTQTAVVARPGKPLEPAVAHGQRPMEERHVWWLVNPNSRNLRTLQRYASSTNDNASVQVDRGSPEKGLRISLMAAYKDLTSGELKELPLTRCIEIWGHVPFGASDAEFQEIMEAIDRVNQGITPQEEPRDFQMDSLEEISISDPTPMNAKRTGIYRAAYTERQSVFCEELKAYIAIPAVPSKYLKWLRQRRAATKEIRNMMMIGRHRNVVHLFEVLELIQENKSTMFLILELVRGGELFDLISSNSAKISQSDRIPEGFTESETVMRKFFLELASGIHYCHCNGIAHRDLKPENLLVHNSPNGDCVLKIADFGLSAEFGTSAPNDNDTVVESLVGGPPNSVLNTPDSARLRDREREGVPPSPSPIKVQMDRFLVAGGNALSFLTCGSVEDIMCRPRIDGADGGGPSPLRRMTSIVGSPHYVAPEIILQSENKREKREVIKGYDGTKADVWSAGVILYAMLFRSLPFGEDLLRCPRFQSYHKWYEETQKSSGRSRRSTLMGALNPNITDAEEKNFLGPHWFFPSKSSRESRDLIVYMLNPNPDMRPSIQLVLQHPWLIK
ncbi:hypothetical protein FisN_19Hh079 [Fistulifera solaris]|uniref:non-specific serine/threonine protein kinase n=1 Tax=Fistulifera solaris TaxID=1519565 RepID=A0A1Z5JZQ2_FISSO|nr:hypothetical protein FisN_19Hh079 [Fistulifera solaris]|eukprot:GAX19504.1 hypothetical protein FisN_19Hh079 [Fistulifera solaris]